MKIDFTSPGGLVIVLTAAIKQTDDETLMLLHRRRYLENELKVAKMDASPTQVAFASIGVDRES